MKQINKAINGIMFYQLNVILFIIFFQTYAHPADELMPLSCKGRYRGSEPDRGDIDEALGKYVLFPFKVL